MLTDRVLCIIHLIAQPCAIKLRVSLNHDGVHDVSCSQNILAFHTYYLRPKETFCLVAEKDELHSQCCGALGKLFCGFIRYIDRNILSCWTLQVVFLHILVIVQALKQNRG